MSKKRFLLAAIFVFSLLLSGCGKKEVVVMDRPAEDGNYHYSNKELSFSVVLPPEFIYYQTQRKDTNNYKDIEFLVPTSDISYPQDVPSYATPIIVRVFKAEIWDEIQKNTGEKIEFKELKREDDKVYTIKFWRDVPKDWAEKWNQEMQDKIVNDFSLIEKEK